MNTHFATISREPRVPTLPTSINGVREFEKETLDAVKVYEDVQSVEERRRKAGQPPVVRFLTSAEQKQWKRPDPSKSEGAGDKAGMA